MTLKNRLLGFLVVATLVASSYAADEYNIDRIGSGIKRIPISMSGYSTEVLSVLRFDLEIQGFEMVGEDRAQYLLKGGNGGQVEGRLTDAVNQANLLAKAYSGGSSRTQAHALADDVIQAVTGREGISRTKIAFKVTKGQSSEIYVSDYDGNSAVALTQDGSVVAAPCWVPGQRKLYYTTYKAGNPDIVSHDLTSGARSAVARYSGLNTSAAVSKDGRKVAMILSKSGSPDVYICNADGSDLKQLTKTKEDESSPTWSPDGRYVCFATRIEGRRVLAKVSIEGGAVQRIPTSGVSNPTEPDWSPDGRYIAFTAQMGGFEICVVPASGGEAKVMVGGEDPSWASNSRTIVFSRRAGSKRVLSLLDVPTKQVKDIGQNLGTCSQPSWAR